MRKVIIRLRPNRFVRMLQKGMYESVEKMEGRELLKLDFERRSKLVIVDLIMRPGHALDDIKFPKGVEILNVLKVEGGTYTVLIKVVARSKKLSGMFKLFDLDVIYDTPFRADRDMIIFSAIGENEPLNRLIKLVKFLGEVEKVSFTNPAFNEHEILKALTDRQRETIIEAKKKGYYEYPRKINTQELSEELGISKATTVEHLRKAEIRLISRILEGY
ncbi:MAG TPA: helix-turn-helix domain-containing protein [Euryarchaeota archaeon]|nr:MAG: bacterio-opsin activator [Thermoplasmatales archaeon ex4484_6]RLF69098.1 MAG: helix-turn-helix domain-containing protein [Thermoplasmata archaeon]HHD15425.1 helix-turn-helix domain-containing protein [Euryarchaeota archaeon]